MIFVTRPKLVHEKQVSFEDILNNLDNKTIYRDLEPNTDNKTITRVYRETNKNTWDRNQCGSVARMIGILEEFNRTYEPLRKADRASLYRSYRIPKEKGGFRPIDEPLPELMAALCRLRTILRGFGLCHHTAAYAYVQQRSCEDLVQVHQKFESKWFLKTDLENFFGSTTLDFAMEQCRHIFPLSEIIKCKTWRRWYELGSGELRYITIDGEEELRKALELCFLRGGLPQGSPISPDLTNWLFIPMDYALASAFAKRKMIYTRYADDMIISARENFPKETALRILENILHEWKTPYVLNQEKTKYMSSSGKNWILGLMLNKDNQITVGYRNKKRFKAMVNNFILDYQNGQERWPKDEIQHLAGIYNYYRNIEEKNIDYIVSKLNQKYGADFNSMLRVELKK